MKNPFECKNCHFIFESECIVNDKNEVIDIEPCTCPQCDSTELIGRFKVDPSKWIGVIGSNG